MKRFLLPAAFLALAACGAPGHLDPARPGPARPAADADGFVPLFNGVDLEGWAPVNCHESTWTVRDGMIVCSGVPTGELRTERMYENFIVELEWRHMKPQGNAGFFVWSDPLPARGQPFTRAVEVQVLDGRETDNYTSHGDVFPIHGAVMTPDRPHPGGWARCLPSEKRAKPSPEWNHYRVTCVSGTLKLEVNGEEVSGGYDIDPRKGYICLESEGSEAHFRNLRIKELPATEMVMHSGNVADRAVGFRSLYNGVDLEGWRVGEGQEGHWKASDWKLVYDGEGDHLWSEEEFGDFELIADWRWSGGALEAARPVILPNGSVQRDDDGAAVEAVVPDAGDSGIYLRGSDKAQVNIWCWPVGSGEVWGYRTDASMPAEVRAACTPKVAADAQIGEWNRFLIRMVGETLTVDLNGERVIDGARLPGVAARGPIALQHHGAPIEFANLFVRELARSR